MPEMKFKKALLGLHRYFIRSTARIILDRNLKKASSLFRSKSVLEIGGSNDSYMFIRAAAGRYLTLNKSESAKPDYIADAAAMPFPEASFDIVLCAEVIEHVFDYQRLIKEIHRVLKDDGMCVASTRFLYKLHDAPQDYFRFSEEALKRLFSDFRGTRIRPMGNRFTVFWDLLCPLTLPFCLVNIISPLVRAVFFWDDERAPSGYFIITEK